MVPKSRVRKKTSEAGLQSADLRKKQRVSSESGEATPTSVETLPSSTASGLEETPAIDVASVAGPSSSVMGASVTGPSTSGADLGAGLEGPASLALALVSKVSRRAMRLLPMCLAWRE